MELQKILRGELVDTPVSIWFDEEWEEYQVVIEGQPDSTYHTDDIWDAVDTSRAMLKSLDK